MAMQVQVRKPNLETLLRRKLGKLEIDRLPTRKQALALQRMWRAETGWSPTNNPRMLSESQAKADKGLLFGWLDKMLHLSPADLSDYEACPWRTPMCSDGCLNMSGQAKFDEQQAGRLNKTEWWIAHTVEAFTLLCGEIDLAMAEAEALGLRLCVRLNGTSDVRWERVLPAWFWERYASVQFYDYTKAPMGSRRVLPANYSLTPSVSEETTDEQIHGWIAAGLSPAVVFEGTELPATYLGHRVIDATKHDMRFLDEPGVIAGLLALGRLKRVKGTAQGFVRCAA